MVTVATPPTLVVVTPAPTKLIVLADVTMVEPSSFTVMPALEPELVTLIVATPPTLLAVTVEPTKLSTVAEVTTLLPSSCTVMPEINGLLLESTFVMVIVYKRYKIP